MVEPWECWRVHLHPSNAPGLFPHELNAQFERTKRKSCMSEKWKSQGFPTFIHVHEAFPHLQQSGFGEGIPSVQTDANALAMLHLQCFKANYAYQAGFSDADLASQVDDVTPNRTTKPSPPPKTENRAPHSSLCLLKDLESAIFEGYTAAFFNPETPRNLPTNRNPPENVDQKRHRKPRASKAAPVVDMGRAKGPATQECRMQPRQPPILQMFWGFYEQIRIFWGCNQDSSDILRIHNGTQQCSIGETMKFNNP